MVPEKQVWVENGVSMAYECGSAAWVFEVDHWGLCGQGIDEDAALRELRSALAGPVHLKVVERLETDERAFHRDYLPASEKEREATLAILQAARQDLTRLLRSCTEKELDWDDPDRTLPGFARWRTLRQIAWHIADTESRYYLPSLDLSPKTRATDLFDELDESVAHVASQLRTLNPALVVDSDGEVWTSVKLLRRLAWHERSELAAMRALVRKARVKLGRDHDVHG